MYAIIYKMKTLGNIISNSFASITLTNGVSFVTITAPPTGIYIISLPPNLGSPGQFLQTNGAGQTSWQTLLPGTGTVTSVNATTPSFLDVTITNPTSNANLAFTLSGTAIPTTSGGTGLNTVGSLGQGNFVRSFHSRLRLSLHSSEIISR